jgi:hypothetical protein
MARGSVDSAGAGSRASARSASRSSVGSPGSAEDGSVAGDEVLIEVQQADAGAAGAGTAATVPLDPAACLPDPARVYRYPVYTPDRYCISAQVPAPPRFLYVRRIGRMYVLRERRDKSGLPQPVCMTGPCWPMVVVTLGLIVGISMAVFFGFFPDDKVWLAAIYLSGVAITVVSFLLTACRDPGVQRIHERPVDQNWTFSEQAQSYRPPGAVYEVESQVLIRNIDHFCPWTGTVIAGGNLWSFYVFTTSLCTLIVLCIVMVVARAISQSPAL